MNDAGWETALEKNDLDLIQKILSKHSLSNNFDEIVFPETDLSEFLPEDVGIKDLGIF